MKYHDQHNITALVPFKNEEQYIPSYCSSILKIVDNVVAVDDSSTDNSSNLLYKLCKENNINVIIEKNKTEDVYYVDRIRKNLLQLGRELKSTHYICLDADETFSGNFISKARAVCGKLQPGQKLTMQWLALWKSVLHYRDDNSIWSNNYKDFIFCDDNTSQTHATFIHENRTPGENTEDNNIRLNPKYGSVLHFQFSDWQSFQLKQAWYRCRELVGNKNSVHNINEKYKITMDEENVTVNKIPEEWLNGLSLPKITTDYLDDNWRLVKIDELFKQYGIEYFKDLQIWHVPEIQKLKYVNR